MTLSGELEKCHEYIVSLVLIPLLVDDPLWALQYAWTIQTKMS